MTQNPSSDRRPDTAQSVANGETLDGALFTGLTDTAAAQDESSETSASFATVDGEDKSEVGDALDWFSDGKETDINGDETDRGIQADTQAKTLVSLENLAEEPGIDGAEFMAEAFIAENTAVEDVSPNPNPAIDTDALAALTQSAVELTPPPPINLPKVELPPMQPLAPLMAIADPDNLSPMSASTQAPTQSGGLSLRNKAVLIALLIGLIPAGVIGGLNLSSVDRLPVPPTEQQVKDFTTKQIRDQILIGLLVTAVGAAFVAYWMVGENTKAQTALALKAKHSHRNLDQPLAVAGDELAIADQTIDALSAQVEKLRHQQDLSLKQAELLTELSRANLSDIDEIQGVIQKNLDQARALFGCERLVFYYHPRYQPEAMVVQALDLTTQGLIDSKDPHPWGQEDMPSQIVAINDTSGASISNPHRQWLEQHQVKASLTVPLHRDNYPLGLLMAHHCQRPHQWEMRERQFLQQLTEELQTTLDRANLIQERNESAQQAQILKELTLKISAAINSEQVFDIAAQEIRLALKADRVIVYRFDATWAGTVIVESVAEGYPKALGATIADPCFADSYVEKYRSGRIQATRDIYNAGLTPCHIGQLKPFEVKANLVAPINYKGNLLGLLIAHQCSGPRDWHQNEIDLFGQLTVQVGLALERSDLLAQQKIAEVEQRQMREKMQKRALELLMEVDPVSRGDLTIRAHVTEDEIGTIADSYNATIESLRRIVTQVQTAASQFTETTDTNEVAVRQLAEQANRQALDVAEALERLQAMNKSIQAVAENAAQAESAVQRATQTVDQGEDAMNRTVDGIVAIRETVAATAKQVKRLGESSQKISKVVNLIGSFADQTNLLALNAAIEAAHAGEEGRGFAVVADEVRSLARQSAEATAEIAQLVATIQAETNEVVNAMEAGTEQVVVGTKLVEETRRSLNQITAVSAQISGLVEAITSAAIEQSQTSESVTQTMALVAQIADKNSSEASGVSATFKELLAVAQSLQEAVKQFKVQ
ncbi:methyl-accepting chemotaxis protein [Synechocystis sp. CACIAM 05]|uniref:methyl-accepting chemotaxis protein n=1 Tax=Synechocystis sp. CACIAM 05 TaxID=1933929 RepID=UPI00138E5869|nr:methyl-accepting chemotaxis protein [Synechocystis sp. CACIAM 05]QHV01227.1 chemotaxis protein [Synechocystis sp. CACIAM 05]